jgi:hypothetical protein
MHKTELRIEALRRAQDYIKLTTHDEIDYENAESICDGLEDLIVLETDNQENKQLRRQFL